MFSAAIAFDQAGADYIEVVSGIAILRVDREGKVNTNAPSTPAASSMPRVSISSRSDKISATAHFLVYKGFVARLESTTKTQGVRCPAQVTPSTRSRSPFPSG
jgi:hypothetical protein